METVSAMESKNLLSSLHGEVFFCFAYRSPVTNCTDVSKHFPSRTWIDQLGNCLLPQRTPDAVPWVTALPGVSGRCPASQAYEMAQPSVFLHPQFLLWLSAGDPVLQRSTPVSVDCPLQEGMGQPATPHSLEEGGFKLIPLAKAAAATSAL